MLDDLVNIYRKLTNRAMARGRVSGVAPDQDFAGIVRTLESHDVIIESDETRKTVTFQAISTANEYFAESIEDLLAGSSRKKKAPRSFYVADLDFLYHGEPADCPPKIKSYLEYTCLVSLLEKISDHHGDATKLIFFHKEKFDIHINYLASHLAPIERLDEFKKNL